MSSLVFSPAIDNSKPITHGMSLYRGMSGKIKSMTPIGPANPLPINLNSPSKVVDLIFNDQKPQLHILDDIEKLGHFVSFSMRLEVACYYATSDTRGDYVKPGYITTVRFPEIKEGITFGGSEPYIFECYDGTVWLDMRHLLAQWHITASRTIVDHELLLLRGKVLASKPISVTPADCDKSFLPWSRTGEMIVIEQ